MSGNHSTVNIKTYQFLYPSVAVWQDFSDLNLLEPNKKSRKSLLKGKKSSHFSGGGNSAQKKESKKMKRKNQPNGRPIGTFIRPSEFTLEYSVLFPSSRAGIRLKPIENPPVPKVDKKSKNQALPNPGEKLKFYVPERAKEVIDEKNEPMSKPVSSWKPPDIRENTELIKEPSLYLDLNYGSDGDIDLIEIQESERKENKRRSVKSKSNKIENCDVSLPQISQDITPSVLIESPEAPKLGSSEEANITEKDADIEMPPIIATFPRLDVGNSDKDTIKTSKNSTPLDKQTSNAKSRALPFIKASKEQSRTAARYSVKSRYMKPKTRTSKADEIELRTKNNQEFVVGGGKALNRKKSVSVARKLKGKVDEKKPLPLFEKRKVFSTGNDKRQAEKEAPSDSLPSICDELTSLQCEQASDDVSEIKFEPRVDCESSQDIINTNELSSSPKLPAVVSARLEEFETEFDERRTGTPRLLEFPLREMKKNEKAMFEEKRAAFRKLDVDGDGHLSLFELMTSFPAQLTKCQVDYIKMIYQKACCSTFFGLEEFLCVDEMCRTMVAMSENLQVAFSRVNLRDVQAKLDDFLLMFVKAYNASSEKAVFQGIYEKAHSLSDGASLKQLLTLFKSLDKDIDKGIRKPDFLLMIPFLFEKDVVLENFFD